jgi:serine/threonine protein kinase
MQSDQLPYAFGKYILLKSLARGGMGELFLALTGEIGGFEKLCVIKRVRASGDNQSLVRRFLDEAKIVVKLSQGNLVQVFDAGFVDDEVYLAMEYVEGEDLRDLMVRCDQTRTRIPHEVGLYICMQVCRGLHYAHNYGDLKLVHRDICPSNVLISCFGEVKVTDFGLAQSVLKQEMTEPGKVYGRFSYMAPEQARRGEIDLRTDVHAVGIMLWELLVGQPMRPGAHKDPSTALSMIRQGKVTPPSRRNDRVPHDLDEIVLKALHSDKKDRYLSAEGLRKALARVLARINPGFDAGGLASFMRHIYGDEIDEARRKRERLLVRDYSKLKGSSVSVRDLSSPAPPPDSGDDLAGQELDGRYRVISLLGEGGMGAVYEAEHNEIGRHVAVKILHSAFSSHPETIARFRQEARAATKIGHPNIVEVTDSGNTDDGRLYFVMELLEGVDLAQVMAETRIVPARRALRMTLQICKGLHAAHEAGIVHRDLKPENIFLTERDGKGDFVKILDFGIAKNIELAKEGDPRLTQPGMAMGTPEYMAPEQAAGAEIDRRIDVYATGAMLYELLTGHLPHEGSNLMQVLSKKASEPPAPPRSYRPQMPRGLEEVILKAMAAQPEDRYPSMEAMHTALLPFTAPGASNWSEAEPGPAPVSIGSLAAGEGVVISPTGSPQAMPPIATDPTVQQNGEHAALIAPTVPLSADKAHMVSPGEVRLSSNVVKMSRQVVPLADATDTSLVDAPTVGVPSIPERRSRGLIVAVAVVLLLLASAAGGYALWSSDVPAPAVDAGVPDLGPPDARVKPAPRPKPKSKPKPQPKKLTPEEVDRLVEWARRAAEGRRYTRPRGDNVKELLARVDKDYPDHPSALRLRKRIINRLERSARRAARRKRYSSADSRLRAWIALEPAAEKPQIRLTLLHVAQGQRALARRKYRLAVSHARSALRVIPDSHRALALMGDIHSRRRRYAQALKHYELAAEAPKVSRRYKRKLLRKIRATKHKLR